MSKIAEIRMLFEAKTKNGVPNQPGSFDQRDLDRVKSDKYLYRLLEHCENNVQLAVEMLFSLMVWRKTNGVNDITEQTVNIQYLKEGIFFPRGRDIDSCIIFIMKSKLFVKGQKDMDALKKVVVYWLERLEREEDGKKITLFFDMDGCGLSNMDIDLITYLTKLLDNYYPNFINYIIVFQLPWMLSAGFKIVKSILPARAVEILKIVNKDKLKELIAPEQSLVSWGGKDEYVFEFISEGEIKQERKEGNDISPGELISLTPSKVITFKTENRNSAYLTIKNMDVGPIAYKIKSTAPEKYSVKPGSGVLASGSSETVQILVNSEFEIKSVEGDRFLVISIKVPKASISKRDINELWKNSSGTAEENKLKCTCVESETVTKVKGEPDSLDVRLKKLEASHEALLQSVEMLKLYQISSITITIVFALLSFILYAYRRNKFIVN